MRRITAESVECKLKDARYIAKMNNRADPADSTYRPSQTRERQPIYLETNQDLIQASIRASISENVPLVTLPSYILQNAVPDHHVRYVALRNPTINDSSFYSHVAIPQITYLQGNHPGHLAPFHRDEALHKLMARNYSSPATGSSQSRSIPTLTKRKSEELIKGTEDIVSPSKKLHIETRDNSGDTFGVAALKKTTQEIKACILKRNEQAAIEKMTKIEAKKMTDMKERTKNDEDEEQDFDKKGLIGAYNLKQGATVLEKHLNHPSVEGNAICKDYFKKFIGTMRQDADNMEAQLPLDTRFERGLKTLLDFKAKHGHFRIPARHMQHKFLSKWISEVRRVYFERTNDQNVRCTIQPSAETNTEPVLTALEVKQIEQFDTSLTYEHIEFLTTMGFEWEPPKCTFNPKSWADRFEELNAFKNEFGHCKVPQKYSENPSLGNWVHTQRKEYEKRNIFGRSTITAEQIEMLNSIGFVWKLRFGRPKKYQSDLQEENASSQEQQNIVKLKYESGQKNNNATLRSQKLSCANNKQIVQNHEKMPTAA